jgi:O-antigen ligase
MFLLIMTVGWLLRIAIFKDVGFMRKNPLNRPILVFSGLAILSTALGVANENVRPLSGFFFVLKLIEYFFLFSIFVNFVKERKDVDRFLVLMLIVGGAISVYGIFKVATGGDVAAPFEGSRGEKNTIGGYLVLIGSVAAGIVLNSGARRERLALLGMLAFLAPVLLFSLSRSSWLASMVAAFVLIFTAKRRKAYLGFIVVFICIFPLLVPEVVTERFEFTYAQKMASHHKRVTVGGVNLDTSLSGRFFDYMEAMRYFPKHPFFGYGITGFHFLDGQFFRVLIEMGSFGLLAFLWLLVRLHHQIRIAYKLDLPPRLHGMVAGFYTGFWAMVAHALSANTFIIVRIVEPFWCLAALTTICALHGESDESWKDTVNVQEEYVPSRDLARRRMQYFPTGQY